MKRYSLLVDLESFHELKKVPARDSPNFQPLLGFATRMARLNMSGTLYEIRNLDCPIRFPITEMARL